MALDGAAWSEIPKNGSSSEIDRGRALNSCCATATTAQGATLRRSEKSARKGRNASDCQAARYCPRAPYEDVKSGK
jgi:hypothetical protein